MSWKQWLAAWSKTDFDAVVSTVVTVFVESALAHTAGPLWLRLETDGNTVTVAVEDTSTTSAQRRESVQHPDAIRGLDIIQAVSGAWGNVPISSGKAVWAAIGPEHRLV